MRAKEAEWQQAKQKRDALALELQDINARIREIEIVHFFSSTSFLRGVADSLPRIVSTCRTRSRGCRELWSSENEASPMPSRRTGRRRLPTLLLWRSDLRCVPSDL